MSANEHGYTIGEPDSRSWLDLYRELEATKQGLAAVQAERDEALKILDTHSRADLLDACRQVKQTAISEADNAKQAESRLAAVRALVVEARRRAPTHGDQEWDWLLGELNTTLLREAEGTPPPQANTPNVLTGYCVNGEHGRCHNNFCGCECHVSGTPTPQADKKMCRCEIPDPVMQADRRFYCHTCSLPVPAVLCEECQRIVKLRSAPAPTPDARQDITRLAWAVIQNSSTDQHDEPYYYVTQRELDALEAALPPAHEGTLEEENRDR